MAQCTTITEGWVGVEDDGCIHIPNYGIFYGSRELAEKNTNRSWSPTTARYAKLVLVEGVE